ncbi:hypothetical protein [Hyphomonas johnsonii]|uniref:Uncharacterized protein n=1 Tax=Hyphomonas johnsonii MHS-2 TaxID=1280950 RepID=A0A059FSG2_9PROT|nr:hypothetical protein [Hyphomonas johnsonii]KCZ93522.1 hypothetical protein HJO_06695 [Hyphomonas johnsonii MHS-2]
MIISNESVNGMFGKPYQSCRNDRPAESPFGHRNFNELATSESHLVYTVCELIGRENLAWVTQFLDCAIHHGPGSIQHDPKKLQRDWYRFLRQAFPKHHILTFALFENILRQLNLSGTSKSYRFIHDVTTMQSGEEIGGIDPAGGGFSSERWLTENILGFIKNQLPPEMWLSIEASSWAGSEGRASILLEIPHVYYLVAVFDSEGALVPYDVIREALSGQTQARNEMFIHQFYSATRLFGRDVTRQCEARNTAIQAQQCIYNAIRRSDRYLSDRDLQFRAAFRGASPDHGISDSLIIGESLARANREYRSIPAGSALDQIIVERRRFHEMAGLICPNGGQPELIKQQERRIMRTPCPMKWKDGKVALSNDPAIGESHNNDGQPTISDKKALGGVIDGLSSYPSYCVNGLATWVKNKMRPKP